MTPTVTKTFSRLLVPLSLRYLPICYVLVLVCFIPELTARCPSPITSAFSFDCSASTISLDTSVIENCGKGCEVGLGIPFLPRPQGLYAPAFYDPFSFTPSRLHGTQEFHVGYRFNQTFHSERIARCLVGAAIIPFNGSLVPTNDPLALLADNFGLSPHFFGTLALNPRIQNNIIDLAATFSLPFTPTCWWERLYSRVSGSLVTTTWDLRTEEQQPEFSSPVPSTATPFPQCAVSRNTIIPAGDLKTALFGNFLFGDMQETLARGRFFLADAQRAIGLSSLDVTLGLDYCYTPEYRAGCFIIARAPTGTTLSDKFVFSPVIGNGHHWELGAGIEGHCLLWENSWSNLLIVIQAHATHLFNDRQIRGFTLANNPDAFPLYASKYLLIKEFDASKRYTGRMTHAVNATSYQIDSSFPVQGEGFLSFLYTTKNCALGFGYDVYGRSTERISHPRAIGHNTRTQNFGVRGDSGVCARGWQEGIGLTGEIITLNSSESNATAFTSNRQDFQVDNPVIVKEGDTFFLAWDSPDAPDTPVKELVIARDSQKNNQPAPIFITPNQITFEGIPSQLMHSIFAHVDYQWDCWCGTPYLGVGGSVSFAHDGPCKACTTNEWTFWVRTSIAF